VTKRWILSSFFSLVLASGVALADGPSLPPLTVEEQDGSPAVIPVLKIKVSNGTLTDDTGGTVSLTTGGGGSSGSPGGSNTQVQFNDAGSFGGDAGLVYNKTTDSLSINGDVTISGDNVTLATNTDRFVLMANGSTYAPEAIDLGTDTTGNYAGSSSEGGAATTATALAANGANCTAGNYPLGVDASGAVETCTADDDVPDAGEVSDTALAAGAVDGGNAGEIEDASVTADDLGADSVSSSELNATGVEAELEAVLDLNELQAQIGDAQIADGAVDGGTGGEIADGSLTTADLGSGSVADDELATTESIQLQVQSAKVTGAFVTATVSGADTSTQGAQIDAGDGNWRLLFDATTDEAAVWDVRLPDYWAAHSELKIMYSMTSGTANEVEFEAAIMCISPGDAADIGTASFAAAAVAADTVPGTAGHPDAVNITLTDDSCAAGDQMFIYVSTDADDATNDDATGDREVVDVLYEFTR